MYKIRQRIPILITSIKCTFEHVIGYSVLSYDTANLYLQLHCIKRYLKVQCPCSYTVYVNIWRLHKEAVSNKNLSNIFPPPPP